MFEHVTLWDVRTDSVKVDTVSASAYRVTLHVNAAKTRTDTLGKESAAAMDDLVDIVVFTADTTAVPLYLRQHRIRSGRQAIAVTVGGSPGWAGIDPAGKLIQRQRGDNTIPVVKAKSNRM